MKSMHFLPRTMKSTRSLATLGQRYAASIAASLLALLSLALTVTSFADVVTLKDGTSVEGRIVVEGTDMLRIEVQVTPSIKETKTYAMTEVAKVEKTAPDKLAFAAINELVPTRSLLTASDYDRMIKDGPQKFLKSFPDSEHKAEVEKILTELKAEKERVQRGGIKLDNEWIDRDERQLYRFAVDARVRLSRIRQKADANNLLGALRDFQTMADSFAETPAYVTAVGEAQKIISAWGSTLQRKLANVDILNQRDDASLKLAAEDQRRRTEAARDAERQQFADLLRREKEQGVIWVSISDRDRQSLESAISIAKAQRERLRSMDVAALDKQAKGLTEANRLLGVGDLAEARLAIAESAVGRSSGGKSRSRSRSKSTSKTATKTTPTSYSQWLIQRISEEEATLAESARAKAAVAEAAQTAKIAARGASKKDGSEATDDAGETPAASDAEASAAAGTPSRAEIMAAEKARQQAKKAAEEKAATDADNKKQARSKKGSSDDDDDEKKKPAAPAASGGGISLQVLVPIIAVLLVVTILVLKKFGIGGKPAASDGDGDGDDAPPAE